MEEQPQKQAQRGGMRELDTSMSQAVTGFFFKKSFLNLLLTTVLKFINLLQHNKQPTQHHVTTHGHHQLPQFFEQTQMMVHHHLGPRA